MFLGRKLDFGPHKPLVGGLNPAAMPERILHHGHLFPYYIWYAGGYDGVIGRCTAAREKRGEN